MKKRKKGKKKTYPEKHLNFVTNSYQVKNLKDLKNSSKAAKTK